MSHSLSPCLLASALSAILIAAPPVSAEDADQAAALAAFTASAEATEDGTSDKPWQGAEVKVTARGTAADWPSALATDVVSWQDAVGSPSDFQDLITRVPGIGSTGQNGIFETFSIRGSGGNGILVLVGGVPVTAQRRAGVPVAFVEPSLLGEINVTRGPATVHFGPGALGGAISIEPRWFDSAAVSAGYANSGDEASLMAGFGTEAFSIAAARHQAGDSEAANGTPLNTSFERESASLQYRTTIGAVELDALLLPSRTENIGKSNSRYPVRDTTYPEDEHTLARLLLRHENGFQVSVHGHDQSLLTYNQRPGSADTYAFVESTDIGAIVQQSFDVGDFSNNVGLEFLGRRGVNGFDARNSVDNRTYSLRDADENAWSLFGLSDWMISPELQMEFGARLSSIDQEQRGADSSDSDQAYTAAAIWSPTDSSRWTLNLSSGYRFATLEERYFSGVTPQGEIVGNPDLGSEHSVGVDIGYAWHSTNWGSEIHLWRTDVDDLIQLFAVAPGVNGYTNVGDARLHGVEGWLSWQPVTNFSLRAGGTLVRSKDELTGNPLFGSPPLTATLDARYDFSRFTLGAFYSHRWKMDRPGFEEVARDAVDVVDLDLIYHVNPHWDLKLYLRNAFDEDYVATADVLSAFAPERSIGLNLSWSAR
jgi:iron complex outermembrane recepter protein